MALACRARNERTGGFDARAWTDETIALPLNSARYAKLLAQKAAASARKKPKKVVAPATTGAEFAKSFGR